MTETEIPNPYGRAELPQLVLPGGARSISESAKDLFNLIAPAKDIFIQDGVVTKLGKKDGVAALKYLKPDEARSTFEKYANLVVNTKQGLAPTICKQELAKAFLCSSEAQDILPKILGLINCPVIYEHEGNLKNAGPGYDDVTQRFVTGTAAPEDVDLSEARGALLGLLDEFQFETPADKSRAVACLIAPALKLGGFIKRRVPADIAQADLSQSEKTYRQLVIAAVITKKSH
jgi:hypothetical protein